MRARGLVHPLFVAQTAWFGMPDVCSAKGKWMEGLQLKKKTFVWDVKNLFDYFSHKGENDQLSDKSLTQKLLILLLLLGGQRINTLYFLAVDRITVTFKTFKTRKEVGQFPL